MTDNRQLLQLLASADIKLSKSDQKLAAIVQNEPASVIHQSIASLAKQANVSEPTVNRFCHKLGCNGYPEFKVKLAAEIAIDSPKMNQVVEAGDSTQQIIKKIFNSNHASLELSEQQCSEAVIDQATHLLTQAKSVIFFGQGSSAAVAKDAQQKFMRFDYPSLAETDYLNQLMMAAGSGPKDVIICISYTGRTKTMIEVAQQAQQSGATVIGLTHQASPLAERCDCVVHIETQEDTELYTPMSSRVAHLVMIDILATSVAMKQGAAFTQRLKRIKNAVTPTKIPS